MNRFRLLFALVVVVSLSLCRGAETTVKPAPPELMLWLRADTLAKTLDDAAEVNSWPDDSGRGNDAVSEQGMEPSFSSKGVGGTPAVLFAGNANAKPKMIQRLLLPLSGEWRGATIFCVGANLQQANWLGTNPGGQGEIRIIGSLQHCNQPTSPSCPLGVKAADGLQMVTIADGLTTDGSLQCDIYSGEKRVSGFTDDKCVYGLMWGKADLGAYLDWASLNGEIDEFIVYRGVLSDDDRTAVEHYLRGKYKLDGAKDDDPATPVGYPLPAAPALPTAAKLTKEPVEDHLQLWLRADDLTLKDGAHISEAPSSAADALTRRGIAGGTRPLARPHPPR